MPVEITMPQLSDTMTEGTLTAWRKKEGDAVKEGEVIAEIETDKANMDMEAFEGGTLAYQAVAEGDKAQVGALLAVLAQKGEDPAALKKQFAQGGGQASTKPTQKSVESNNGKTEPQPAAAAAGGAQGASSHDTELGRGNIEEGRAQSRRESVQEPPEHTSEALSREASQKVGQRPAAAKLPSAAPENEPPRLKVSPLARRIAASMDVDLQSVKGSGPGGRIVQRDVMEMPQSHGQSSAADAQRPPAAKAAAPKPASPLSLAPRVGQGHSQVVALSKIRSVIAQRLQHSKQTIPHFYETIDVDVEAVLALRARLNKSMEKEGIRLSLADFLAKGLAIALLSHPELNSTFDGKEITRHGDVNLGMAVALPDGLIVPVLRNVQQMGLREIRLRSSDLVERARNLKLRQEEMSGATFTVSNLGTFGVREFSAIINPPEVAILAIASAQKRAVVFNDAIAARTMMSLTLSSDHRCVDGATAAEFLRTLQQLLEEPGLMLV